MASRFHPVIIANGASVSGAMELREGERIVGCVIPTAWTTANLRLQALVDGTNWRNVTNSSGAVEAMTGQPDNLVDAPPTWKKHIHNQVRVQSVTAADPNVAANQGGDRTVLVVVERFF